MLRYGFRRLVSFTPHVGAQHLDIYGGSYDYGFTLKPQPVSALACHIDASALASPTTRRNRLCACESGLRYKYCCGALGLPRVALSTSSRRQEGLDRHLEHALFSALSIYDHAIQHHPGDWDVAHMRALALYQLGALRQSCEAFASLVGSPACRLPGFWQNLGLLMATAAHDVLDDDFQITMAEYHRFQLSREREMKLFQKSLSRSPASALPSVSVVMPSYNHESYVAEAVRSVLSQTRLPCELIVIDDGSTDATLAVVAEALAGAPMPVTLIARENRGAGSALNEAIDVARGSVIQLLNSDDRLPSHRIEVMSTVFAALPVLWATARVRCIDPDGGLLHSNMSSRAHEVVRNQDGALQSHSHGLSLLTNNFAISTGNLTFRKCLWQQLGGFAHYRYNHDWDFALRASLLDEPLLLARPLYDYRIHASNTIAESRGRPRAELLEVMRSFVDIALASTAHQPFAPVPGVWKNMWFACIAASQGLQHVPAPLLRAQLLGETVGQKAAA